MAGVHSAPHDPAQGVPGTVVKPVKEVVETMLDHVGCRTVVKPGIKLMDDALESDDSKEPGGEPSEPGEGQDSEHDQTLGPRGVQEGRLGYSHCPSTCPYTHR